MKLKDGDKYINNITGDEYTLTHDYNGDWYLKKINNNGYAKTLSVNSEEMITSLLEYWNKKENKKMSKFKSIEISFNYDKKFIHFMDDPIYLNKEEDGGEYDGIGLSIDEAEFIIKELGEYVSYLKKFKNIVSEIENVTGKEMSDKQIEFLSDKIEEWKEGE